MNLIDWRHWHNEPYLIGGLVVLAWGYALLTGPLRSKLTSDSSPLGWRSWSYYASLVLFYLAVGSPFDQLGERFLFSAHMAQHVVLIYPCAILLLIGLPPWLLESISDRPGLQQIGWFFTRPVVAGILYVMVQSVWHIPALYDLALQDRFVHVLEHVTFFGSALLFWYPILGNSLRWPNLADGGQMLYLFAVAVGLTPLFVAITFSSEVLYPTYEFAPRIIENFGPMDDQLFAGAIMKLSNVGMTFLAFCFIFVRWYRRSEAEYPA